MDRVSHIVSPAATYMKSAPMKTLRGLWILKGRDNLQGPEQSMHEHPELEKVEQRELQHTNRDRKRLTMTEILTEGILQGTHLPVLALL